MWSAIGDTATATLLAHMPQQLQVRNEGDDWTGITSTTLRRKLQNRLNARAHRQRARKVRLHGGVKSHTTTQEVNRGSDVNKDRGSEPRELVPLIDRDDAIEPGCLITRPETTEMLHNFARQAYMEYMMKSPRPSNLRILIRLNVLKALSHNATLLGFEPGGLCRDDAISPFSFRYPDSLSTTEPLRFPASLEPTELQRVIPHHPWIDLFPIPAMRDNALQACQSGLFDEDELCLDLLEVEDAETERPALIVWGAPWDIRGWEASATFIRKWGWLIRGCKEILESTNYWRQKRGEKILMFEKHK